MRILHSAGYELALEKNIGDLSDDELRCFVKETQWGKENSEDILTYMSYCSLMNYAKSALMLRERGRDVYVSA